MRALHWRPTTLERWPNGVHPGMVLATREDPRGGDAFFQKRIPKGAPEYVQTARIAFPSGRTADEICPTEIAVVGWCAQMGAITFHPWPVRSDDVDHPDELRLDLDPQPGTDFADAVRVAGVARGLLEELGYVGFPKTSGGRGVHIYVRDRAPLDVHGRAPRRDRGSAVSWSSAFREVTTRWWKEERGERIFVDYNQNARDRTIASASSIRPKPGAPVSAPLSWDELDRVQPEDFTVATMPARFARIGEVDPHAAVLVEHPRAVVPVGEDALVRPPLVAMRTRLSVDAGRLRQSPGGWRATKPAVLRCWLVQRVPPPDSALVSKRRPSTTMNAWPALA